jgi:hypothetical protein
MQAVSGDKTREAIMSLLRDSPIFKNMGNFAESLKSLLSSLPDAEAYAEPKAALERFLVDIQKLDAENLPGQVKRSGIGLEATLAKFSGVAKESASLLASLKSAIAKGDFKQAEALVRTMGKLADAFAHEDGTGQIAKLPPQTAKLVDALAQAATLPTLDEALGRIEKALAQLIEKSKNPMPRTDAESSPQTVRFEAPDKKVATETPAATGRQSGGGTPAPESHALPPKWAARLQNLYDAVAKIVQSRQTLKF